jgi:aspartate kinase
VGVVMKFGGTSVADPEAITRLMGIVRGQLERSDRRTPPVVVVSALAGVTDQLVAVARLAEEGEADRAAAALHALLDRHVAVATAVTNGNRPAVVAQVTNELNELIGLVHALAVLREVSPRSLDAVLAVGELVSSRIVAAALADDGIPSAWVDARTVLATDAEHTGAAPDMIETCKRARERVAPFNAAGSVVVLGGFIGATANGVTTTLGRGGSDYSAAIFGACLGVDEIQIWTDVDGMLTADPRIVAQPRVVPQLTFAEASELAYFGAKVLHPSTILPAVSKNIPVRILNSRRPENPGTRITAEVSQAAGALTAIACKRDVTVIDITSTRMLMAHGFLRRLFEVLESILDNLRHFADASCEREMAIICAVGENLTTDPTLFGRAVTALDRVPLRLVSQAASRRNITFVLRDADVPHAMMRLHEAFF